MNVSNINFRNISNVYQSNKMEAKPSIIKKIDSIEISELGKYLNKVNANKEEINTDKVNQIKNKIENGTYKIDSNTLAKKIIEHMKGDKS